LSGHAVERIGVELGEAELRAGSFGVMIDLSRLTPEQREMWDWTFPDGFPAEEGWAFRLWSHGTAGFAI
jgi:hypothetical protein